MHLDFLGGRKYIVQFARRDDAAPEIDENGVGDGSEF